MGQEIALNLQPGDEIEWMPDEWWTVVAHSVNVDGPAGVTIELRSVADPEFFAAFSCSLGYPFNYRHICNH